MNLIRNDAEQGQGNKVNQLQVKGSEIELERRKGRMVSCCQQKPIQLVTDLRFLQFFAVAWKSHVTSQMAFSETQKSIQIVRLANILVAFQILDRLNPKPYTV